MEKGQRDAYIGYDGKSTADIAYPTMFNDPERFARDSPFLARLFRDFSHTDEFTRALRMCDYEYISVLRSAKSKILRDYSLLILVVRADERERKRATSSIIAFQLANTETQQNRRDPQHKSFRVETK